MKIFARLTICARLGAGFAALIALATLVVVVGLTRLHTISAELALIRSGRAPTVQQVFDIVENANVVARELRHALLRDDPAKVAASLAERVAASDHSSRIKATSHDAIGKLLQAL